MREMSLAIALAVSTVTLPLLQQDVHAETSANATPSSKNGGQDELALFRASMRIDRREFVKQSMDLRPEEGKKFWSLYHQYEADLMRLNDQRLAIIKDYEKSFDQMTDSKAAGLVKRSMAFRKTRSELLETYYGKIAKATSKIIGARFLQVESVLQGAGDVAVGSSIPLMPKMQ